MAAKNAYLQDPEYEAIPASFQEKRIKLMEDSGRLHTKKKIEGIITANFNQEINSKGAELDCLDDYLYEARSTLDRLRACAITKYYANVGQEQTSSSSSENIFPSIHPTSKKYLGKSPKYLNNVMVEGNFNSADSQGSTSEILSSYKSPVSNQVTKKAEAIKSYLSPSKDISSRAPRIKVKIIIGNISKFIPVWMRDESDQHITHKWMIYVRGDKNGPTIESFVKKVRFFLHSSYRPNDIVEICSPPFHLIKRGWGEFEVRVQIFFHDPRNKPVDIQHTLKLDKTFTGLQTLGNETVVDLQLFKADASGSNPCASLSTILSNSSLQSSYNLQQNHVSYNELNADSTIAIKAEPDVESENSVDVSGTDSLMSPPPVQNISNKKLPKENSPDITSNSALSNGSLFDGETNDIPDRTTIPKPVVPIVTLSRNTDTDLKPVNNFVSNGVNTAYLKCRDKEGRVLIVPQSSLVCIKSRKLSGKTSTVQTTPDKLMNSKTSVPSYFLKVVPNQDSGQNQLLLIAMAEKKIQCTDVKMSAEVACQSGLGFSNDSNSTDSSQKLKPGVFWDEELNNIKIEYYKSFVDLLKRVCKAIPLVKKNIDRSLYPFCASSMDEFLRWTIGKQRACEWKRAGLVRTAILNILKKNKFPYATEESVWPRHVIMTWCRKNGFVPMVSEKMTLLPEPKWSGVELCSVSNANDLFCSLHEDHTKLDSTEDDLEIDILEDTKADSSILKNNQNHLPLTRISYIHPAAAFVKEVSSQMGVNIKPIEMEPSIFMPTIEEMILAACRELAADIIRSSVNAGYNRMGGQLCPEEITVSDVYSAIKDTPQFDFLTNSYLGVPKEAKGDT
ncbi:YEATS domain-containing protein 2-like [Argiope bruennichi]|uniref:YEATS domain-containing protein 2-like n=1 Tax=Argiope bruennichi TaxID=94029 RepID=UPI0024944844|nr:YEATS domain-containing protein 2-like [Argiope bruennichi]